MVTGAREGRDVIENEMGIDIAGFLLGFAMKRRMKILSVIAGVLPLCIWNPSI
jgi:hypothetical protein